MNYKDAIVGFVLAFSLLAICAAAQPVANFEKVPVDLSQHNFSKVVISASSPSALMISEILRPASSDGLIRKDMKVNRWNWTTQGIDWGSDLHIGDITKYQPRKSMYWPGDEGVMPGTMEQQGKQTFMGQTDNINLKSIKTFFNDRGGGSDADWNGISLKSLQLRQTSVSQAPAPGKDFAGKDGFIYKLGILGNVPVPAYATPSYIVPHEERPSVPLYEAPYYVLKA